MLKSQNMDDALYRRSGGARGSATGLLSACYDLRGREFVARRSQFRPEPASSLVSLGDLWLGNWITRAWPERLLLSLVRLTARADDSARVGTAATAAGIAAAIARIAILNGGRAPGPRVQPRIDPPRRGSR